MQLTPKEGYALMNLLVAEATGVNDTISVIDTSTFVSAGETVLATGRENVLNALSIIISRTLVRVDPINARFSIITDDDESIFAQRTREIFFYDDGVQPAGNWNTKEGAQGPGYINLADGFDNGSNNGASLPSMWQQRRKPCLELNWCGSVVYDYGYTLDDDAFKIAFTDVDSFDAFVSGMLTEIGNDITSTREAWRRAVFLNRLGEAINGEATFGTAFNLTKEYNDKFGTNYTSEQLRTTYLDSFLKFFVSFVRNLSNFMTYRTKKYHNPHTFTDDNSIEHNILVATNKNRQRMCLYSPLFIESEAWVFPEIFNPQYLDIKNYEGIDWWQNIEDPSSIKVTPTAIVNGVQTSGSTVDCPFVIGAIWDDRAVKAGMFLEKVNTTPLEARKGYRNIWHHFMKRSFDCDVYPFIALYMQDPSNDGGSDDSGSDDSGSDTPEG